MGSRRGRQGCQPGRKQHVGSNRGHPGCDSEVLGDIAADPVQVRGDPGVDARPVGPTTTIAPAHHTCLHPGVFCLADQRSSGVSLERTGVSTLVKSGWGWQGEGTGAHLTGAMSSFPSTQHIVTDNADMVTCADTFVIHQVTKVVFYNGNLHLHQRKGWQQIFCG